MKRKRDKEDVIVMLEPQQLEDEVKEEEVHWESTLSEYTKINKKRRKRGGKTQLPVVETEGIMTKPTVKGGYCVVPSAQRFLLLFGFLKKNQSKKAIVLFNTCISVKYHSELLRRFGVVCFEMHGKRDQIERASTFFDFCRAEKGILLCTGVGARGLNIHAADWIVQYDPPDDTKDYIRRVGGTARGEGAKGKALLFLLPQEIPFLKYLREAKVPLNEYVFDYKVFRNVQGHLEDLVRNDKYLIKLAEEAFKGYILTYGSSSMDPIFDVRLLNLKSVAASFCLSGPPEMNLPWINQDNPCAVNKTMIN